MNSGIKYFTRTTVLTNYIPIPRDVLKCGLSSTALLLYGLLLDRCTLSRKNGYFLENGEIYVIFPVLECADALGISTTTVKVCLGALEGVGLIRRVRRKRQEANRIYLRIPESALTVTGRDGNCPSERRKTDLPRDRKPAPNNLKEQPDYSNCYQPGGESL